jgi:hypothetical protein
MAASTSFNLSAQTSPEPSGPLRSTSGASRRARATRLLPFTCAFVARCEDRRLKFVSLKLTRGTLLSCCRWTRRLSSRMWKGSRCARRRLGRLRGPYQGARKGAPVTCSTLRALSGAAAPPPLISLRCLLQRLSPTQAAVTDVQPRPFDPSVRVPLRSGRIF